MQGNNFRAEAKLLVFFLYFAFAVNLSLIFFTIALGNTAKNQEEFTKYFTCEALGADSDDPCILEVDRQGNQGFNIVSYAMYAISPFITLVYVVPVDKIKERWRTWRHKSPDISSQQEARFSSMVTQFK